jgi:dihydrodipicolinate synthase/N-acetylneuraminate lyase
MIDQYPRCILGTCCIPWTKDFAFDEPLFRRSVEDALLHGTRHLYIFGTAGEGHAVSDRQFQQITRAFADTMSTANAQPMVGLISTSLPQVLDRIEFAKTLGIRQFQLSLPSWGTCTPGEAFTFFQQVCGRFSDCSFLHYNLRRAGRLLQPDEYGRLSAAFPNLVAAKLAGATGEDAFAIHKAAPSIRLFLTETAFADACARGVPAGFLISYASTSWRHAKDYFAACLAGDLTAVAEHRRQQDLVLTAMRNAIATAMANNPPHMDGAFDQLFVKRHLPEFPLRLLPPYIASSDDAFNRFIAGVREVCPDWLR